MHSNLSITDSTYAILSDMDVKAEIHRLLESNSQVDVLQAIRDLLSKK